MEVVLNTGGMTQEGVEKIVKQYIDAEFAIALIETNIDEMRVIAEFVDAEVAQELVRNVYDAHRLGEGRDQIKIAKTILKDTSISPSSHPMMLFSLI